MTKMTRMCVCAVFGCVIAVMMSLTLGAQTDPMATAATPTEVNVMRDPVMAYVRDLYLTVWGGQATHPDLSHVSDARGLKSALTAFWTSQKAVEAKAPCSFDVTRATLYPFPDALERYDITLTDTTTKGGHIDLVLLVDKRSGEGFTLLDLRTSARGFNAIRYQTSVKPSSPTPSVVPAPSATPTTPGPKDQSASSAQSDGLALTQAFYTHPETQAMLVFLVARESALPLDGAYENAFQPPFRAFAQATCALARAQRIKANKPTPLIVASRVDDVSLFSMDPTHRLCRFVWSFLCVDGPTVRSETRTVEATLVHVDEHAPWLVAGIDMDDGAYQRDRYDEKAFVAALKAFGLDPATFGY